MPGFKPLGGEQFAEPPAGEDDFERAWFGRNAAVWVAVTAGRLAGSYYLAPNYPGRAAHIGNAGKSGCGKTWLWALRC